MPTTYTDQFFTFDPANPPPGGTPVSFVNLTLTDQNDDGDIDQFDGDAVDGSDVTASYPGDTVTITVAGVGNITYVGITFYLADGQRVFTPTDGQVLQDGTLFDASFVFPDGPLDVGDLGPPCFAAGTRIDTADGAVPVEQIEVGDLIETMDHGLQPVRWHGVRSVAAMGRLAPIRFAAGSIGNARPLWVSPQHKMLVTGWRAEVLFGEAEVLVAAQHLVNHDTICRQPQRQVSYHHLMFDSHEVIFAEAAPSESFFPGPQIMSDEDLHHEIQAVFPQMVHHAHAGWALARPTVTAREAKVLCGDTMLAA